jgi:hypothetical protein
MTPEHCAKLWPSFTIHRTPNRAPASANAPTAVSAIVHVLRLAMRVLECLGHMVGRVQLMCQSPAQTAPSGQAAGTLPATLRRRAHYRRP